MDSIDGEGAKGLFQAQAHIWNHIFSFINSMSLNCAVQLGIPDIIHNHDQPVSLSELVTALGLPQRKATCLYKLMRILVHSGFFARQKVSEDQQEEGYVLTPSSRLLLKDNSMSLYPLLRAMLDPILVTPWHFLSTWFQRNELTAFESAHGRTLWDYACQDFKFNNFFNEAMASDARLLTRVVVTECKAVFEGSKSLVDVGGGTGTLAKSIAETFPHLKCTVFDLPHVVDGLQGGKNLDYIGGDMFGSIPHADAVLLKWILHDWSDEQCVKILKQCRASIPSKDKGGKVIIIEMVMDEKEGDHESTETKLFFDMLMMTVVSGRERTEKEWEKLFFDAGFTHYKITHTFGLRSLIEVYP